MARMMRPGTRNGLLVPSPLRPMHIAGRGAYGPHAQRQTAGRGRACQPGTKRAWSAKAARSSSNRRRWPLSTGERKQPAPVHAGQPGAGSSSLAGASIPLDPRNLRNSILDATLGGQGGGIGRAPRFQGAVGAELGLDHVRQSVRPALGAVFVAVVQDALQPRRRRAAQAPGHHLRGPKRLVKVNGQHTLHDAALQMVRGLLGSGPGVCDAVAAWCRSVRLHSQAPEAERRINDAVDKKFPPSLPTHVQLLPATFQADTSDKETCAPHDPDSISPPTPINSLLPKKRWAEDEPHGTAAAP